MQSFLEEVKRMFVGVTIVTLGDLVYRVVNISKVRIGDDSKRSYDSYDEISLNHIDAYGYIRVPSSQKTPKPANPTSIHSQSLHYGDIILSLRGNIYKVGVVDKEYRNTIVGNTSMIRIQVQDPSLVYSDHTTISTSRFIQAYLQTSFVQKYLSSLVDIPKKGERKLLSSAMLLGLPIPRFEESVSDVLFVSIIKSRITHTLKVQKMSEDVHNLAELLQKRREDALLLPFDEMRLEKIQEDQEIDTLFIEMQSLLERFKKVL